MLFDYVALDSSVYSYGNQVSRWSQGLEEALGEILEEFSHGAANDVAFPSVKSSLRARICFNPERCSWLVYSLAALPDG